jgi:hypothetical protein
VKVRLLQADGTSLRAHAAGSAPLRSQERFHELIAARRS